MIGLVLGWLISYTIGLGSYNVIAWIPFSLLAFVLVPNVAKAVVPPKLERYTDSVSKSALRRNVELFLSVWFYCAFGALVVIFGPERFVMSLLGASSSELSGIYGLLSEPLGEASSAFRVSPETALPATCAVALANTFVWSVALFPMSKIIRGSMKRNRVIRLGLDRPDKDGEKEDDT
jgi:hypothetical protein